MASSRQPTAVFLLVHLLLFLHVETAAPPPAAVVRTLCKATLYRGLCNRRMSKLPPSVTRSPTKLAGAAVGLALGSADGRLQDCVENMRDCADRLRESVRELAQLGRPGSPGFVFRVDNVQTWVSAALTDADTCLGELPPAPAAAEKVSHAMQMTSNALVFVNSLAAKN
ncbi:unnamed protein product [Spirodela intermedia]|uniref:Pectinesterase inhibitor domain-containing protein n=1 Tax=Spirodela intermedia TaxID=51605 RepID=A0A7I8II99_SPIIN|nr:unnamed protein product [Spirodela intermedia]CAA6656885.1 unnamed protein product [Spirodela intermedia]